MQGALGAVRMWRWLIDQPAWLRQPWLGTLILGVFGGLIYWRASRRRALVPMQVIAVCRGCSLPQLAGSHDAL